MKEIMLSKETIEELKKDCSFEEIQEIDKRIKKFEKDGIAYDLDEAFFLIKQELFSKKKLSV